MAIGDLGVCSWSLRPEDAESLAVRLKELGLTKVQLALGPLMNQPPQWDSVRRLLSAAGIEIASGMFAPLGEDYSTLDSIARTGGLRPDATWESNRQMAQVQARIAENLGITLVTFHAGFFPHEAGNPERVGMIQRLREIAEVFGAHGCRIALETGQERAETLAAVMHELADDRIGVNFDPANMLLYGMGDPVEAITALGKWVMQVHIKDANPSPTRGEWGTEVPVGQGSVPWRQFLEAVEHLPQRVNLMVEREAGRARSPDIALAVQHVRQELPRAGQ